MIEKYIFKNYRTRPYAQKTFESQSDCYVVADLARADNPSKIIDVVVYFGSGTEVLINDSNANNKPLPSKYYEPFYGEFVDVQQDSPLYRRYTKDDAYLGRCKPEDVGTYVRNPDGSFRIYNSIKVFCEISTAYYRSKTHPILKKYTLMNVSKYASGWDPNRLARYKKDYCYVEIAQKSVDCPF